MFFGAIYPVDIALTNAHPAPHGVPASIDFETRSTVDLKSAGARRYAQHHDTRVLCMFVAIGPAEAIWVPGMPIPQILADAIGRGEIIQAWNATFEVAIWQEIMVKRHGWPDIPAAQFRCTMQKAALVGCPGALERAVVALGLPVAKDMDGHRLMLKMCKPLPARKDDPPALVRWHDDPIDHLRLQRYCRDDVRAEVMAAAHLPEPPPMEVAVMRVDREINLRGIRVDRAAAEGAAKIAREEKRRLNAEIARLTNGTIKSTNQVAVILDYLNRRGIQHDPLPASAVRDFLNANDESDPSGDLDVNDAQIDAYTAMHGGDPAAVQVLRLRAEAAKASTAKLDALVKGVSAGDRMTDLFAYAGAYRTQRWAGRRFQAHNLPRANPPCETHDEIERWYETLARGRYDDFCELLPLGKNGKRMTVMDGLKASLRGFLMASTGCNYVVADLGQIEARGAAWIAGQWDLIHAFERLVAAVRAGADEATLKGLDIYTVNGRKMNVDRQGGKIATLACFAADTRVLVLRDGVETVLPITDVRVTDLTFDGVEWVRHAGVVPKGEQTCMTLSGTKLTPGHLVWCGRSTGWAPAARVGSNENILSQALDIAAASLSSQGIYYPPVAASMGWPFSATAGDPRLKQKLPVFDIAYSGPRNRFTIITDAGPLIVHNCGYQGGWNALMVFAAAYGTTFTEVEARNIVDAYRAANPMIVRAWAAEERAAIQAMENPGMVIPLTNGRDFTGAYCFKGGNLMRKLPSGRCLIYRRMAREPRPTAWGKMKMTLTYEGNIFAKGQPGTFVRLSTYGGKLFQNATQAICRDILAAGLIRSQRFGLPIALHVHDEQGIDSPAHLNAEHAELVVKAATDPIDWVPGLPVTSSADISHRYRKG